jgi:hypothetical protein
MRELALLAIYLLVTPAKLLRPGGIRAVAAESLLLKHQILIGNRARRRAPNLTTVDRVLLGLTTLFVNPRRIPKRGALIKPATLFKFHRALVDRKYRLLFSSSANRRTSGPKGPSPELIAAVIELKHRNPRFGCVRLAQQIADAFGVELDKDVVRRVLAKHYRPDLAHPGRPRLQRPEARAPCHRARRTDGARVAAAHLAAAQLKSAQHRPSTIAACWVQASLL